MASIYGNAGGSLGNAGSWGGNVSASRAGARGEQLTAAVLNQLAKSVDGLAVLHDLRIPIPGVKANIDHAIVSGDRVLLLDSKLWRPGFYWTIAGRTRRGLQRFEPADKKTLPMAYQGIGKLLQNTGARLPRPLLVVWPSQPDKPQNLVFCRPAGADMVTGAHLETRLTRLLPQRADPQILAALRRLLIKS